MSGFVISVSGESTIFTKNTVTFDIDASNIILGNGWTDISYNAFPSSISMQTILIPNTLTTISDYAFKNVSTLTSINFTYDSSLSTIGKEAFSGTSINEIKIPSSVRSIHSAAFLNSNLTTVYMYEDTLDLLNSIASSPNLSFDIPQEVYGKTNVTIKNLGKLTTLTYYHTYSDDNIADSSYNFKIPIYKDISGILTQSSYISDISNIGIIYLNIGTTVTEISDNTFKDASNLEILLFNKGSQTTTIGKNAFENCTNLSNVNMPNTIANIKEYAFKGATNLNTIDLGIDLDAQGNINTSLIIGKGAFMNTSLTYVNNLNNKYNVDLPVSLQTIEEETFSGTSITNIYIPYSVTNIGVNAFQDISNIIVTMFNKTINTLNKTTAHPNIVIGINSSFYGASNVDVTIPDDSLYITKDNNGNDVYSTSILNDSTKISTPNVYYVDIGKLVTSIPAGFMSGNTTINTITIPYTVTSINNSAFSNATALVELNFSNSIDTISIDAFNGATALTKFNVDICSNYFTTDTYGVLYNKDMTTLIHYPDNNNQVVYDIPDSVVTIGPYSFQDVSSVLENINIPSSVNDICNNAFVNSNIQRVVFDESTNVDTLGITLGSNVTFYDISANVSIITKIFNGIGDLSNATLDLSGANMVNVQGYSSIGADAFLSASDISDVKISGSVTSIGANAFKNASSLSSIFIPSSVTRIGATVFDGASSLTSIYIPPSVTDISSNAFAGASGLTTVYMLEITASYLSLQTGIPINFYGKENVTITTVTYNSSYILDRIYNNLDFVNFMKTRISNLFVVTGITSDFPAVNSSNKYISYITRSVIPGYELINLSIYNKKLLVDLIKTIYSREMSINANNLKVTLTDGSITINIAVLKEGVTESMVPICFPAGTLVTTDQGSISIEELEPDIHTIRGKQIVAITQTTPIFKHIICIQKDALGMNIPNRDVCISNEHKVFYKGKMVKAKDLIGLCKNVTKVPYNGEILYNVLLEKHDKMLIHNLICETLDPENIMAKICKGNHSTATKNKIFMELNKIIKTNDVVAYKNVCDYLSKQL